MPIDAMTGGDGGSGEPGLESLNRAELQAACDPNRLPLSLLVRHLKKKGWSDSEFANAAKVDSKTVNSYLNGTSKPYPSTLKKMADSLGIDPSKMPE